MILGYAMHMEGSMVSRASMSPNNNYPHSAKIDDARHSDFPLLNMRNICVKRG